MRVFRRVPLALRILYATILLISIFTIAVYFTKHASYEGFKTQKIIQFHRDVVNSK